jgi:Asp-tRNA(Asn)/Glu-tRNA(Gln) amidotransferase B subunit
VSPAELAKLVAARSELQREAFDEALTHVGDDGFAAEPYLAQKTVSDISALDPVIEEIVAANAGEVAAYRGGKEGLLGFFVGQVMKATGGKADPRVVNERLREKLKG